MSLVSPIVTYYLLLLLLHVSYYFILLQFIAMSALQITQFWQLET